MDLQSTYCINKWFHFDFIALDTAVQSVVEALKDRKYADGSSVYDNTYIVFTSDNGGNIKNAAKMVLWIWNNPLDRICGLDLSACLFSV